MAQYVLYGSGRTNNSSRFLLGPPLVVISVFCFAFVMMHPRPSVANHPLATAKQTTNTSSPTPAKLSLPSNQQAQATPITEPSSTTNTLDPPTSTGSTSPTVIPATSQSAGSIATKLQAAIPNNQTSLGSKSNTAMTGNNKSDLIEISLPKAKNLLKALLTPN